MALIGVVKSVQGGIRWRESDNKCQLYTFWERRRVIILLASCIYESSLSCCCKTKRNYFLALGTTSANVRDRRA